MAKKFIVAALLAGAAWLPAQAQDRPVDLDRAPSVGKIVTGEVAEGGGTTRYLLTLRAGQAVDLTAAPVAGSDPALKVYDAATDALMAENDDSSGTLAANLRLYSEQTKRVRIEVSNAALEGGEAAMRFDLILRPSDWRPKPVLPLALGESRSGTLLRNDEQRYGFTAERGQLWDLVLAAAPGSALDPALQVFGGEATGGGVLGEDDDGGGGLNARLRFRVPETGAYTLRIHTVGTSEGAYTLSAGVSAATPVMAVMDVEVGTPAYGTLELGSDEHFYRLSESARAAIAAGSGSLVVDLRRVGDAEEGSDNVLDPVLDIGFETPLGFSSLRTDDDGGENGNSRITFDTANLGPAWLEALRIKASSFLESAGHYELVVSGE